MFVEKDLVFFQHYDITSEGLSYLDFCWLERLLIYHLLLKMNRDENESS